MGWIVAGVLAVALVAVAAFLVFVLRGIDPTGGMR